MTSDDLRKRFEDLLKSGHRFVLRRCSFCNYPLAWECFHDHLYFDGGCDCVRGGSNPREVRWSDLDFYLDPNHGHIEAITAWVENGGRH